MYSEYKNCDPYTGEYEGEKCVSTRREIGCGNGIPAKRGMSLKDRGIVMKSEYNHKTAMLEATLESLEMIFFIVLFSIIITIPLWFLL